MCRLKIYLGVEIGGASGVASWILIAFFFEENGILYLDNECVLESLFCDKNYKLDNSNNTHELVARD